MANFCTPLKGAILDSQFIIHLLSRLAMPDLRELHQRIFATKQEKKKLNDIVHDVLAQSKPYQDLLEEIRTLRAKKMQMETEIYREVAQERDRIEHLSEGISSDMQILSDLALTLLMKGEPVEITDENDIKYQPVFKVTFKRAA